MPDLLEHDDDDLDCGHIIGLIVVDGRMIEVHHDIPDDGAPHAPTSECGCGPQVHQTSAALWVYAHVDQDPHDTDLD